MKLVLMPMLGILSTRVLEQLLHQLVQLKLCPLQFNCCFMCKPSFRGRLHGQLFRQNCWAYRINALQPEHTCNFEAHARQPCPSEGVKCTYVNNYGKMRLCRQKPANPLASTHAYQAATVMKVQAMQPSHTRTQRMQSAVQTQNAWIDHPHKCCSAPLNKASKHLQALLKTTLLRHSQEHLTDTSMHRSTYHL